MNPFYFGEGDSQLYGVLHPASGMTFKNECIVFCYPFGQEYELIHRAFRNLAVSLSEKGYEVLRFDYFGTGDSAGASDTIDIDLWKQNILTAIKEAQDCSGVDTVNLVGLRLGASLALAISDHVKELKHCVAWDPILNGQDYLKEIINYLEPQYISIANDESDQSLVYLNGYPLPAKFRRQLRKINLEDIHINETSQYTIVASQESNGYSSIKDHLCKNSNRVTLSLIPFHSNWNESDDDGGGILLPQPIISGIVDLFN